MCVCSPAGSWKGGLSSGLLKPGGESLSMWPTVVSCKQYKAGFPFVDPLVFCRKGEMTDQDPQYLTMYLLGLFCSLFHHGSHILTMGLLTFGK